MSTIALVGTQWGDEGKGKIIDILSASADIVVRAQGGDNAGHTVIVDDQIYKLHLIPSGILYKGTVCVIGCGTAINPKSLWQEIDSLKNRGIDLNQLKIDERAHVVMPYHILLDKASEDMREGSDIGTTKKGIGPCYMDKAERTGIRICDLVSENFGEILRSVIEQKNRVLEKLYEIKGLEFEEVYQEFSKLAQQIKPYVCDTSALIYNAIKDGKQVLFEGAQGTLLDLDMGTYPYVTSSHPTSGGFCIGTGIGPTLINECIGIAKAYTTRVGKGPFPTELDDDIGTFLREQGMEFGTTTGRARRCGWLDLVILRYAVRVNGLTQIALNKLDTLSGLDTLKVCIDYEYKGESLHDFPSNIDKLSQCKPIYVQLKGWKQDISNIRNFDDLPAEAKDYVKFVEENTGCRVSMVGVGGKREQNLNR